MVANTTTISFTRNASGLITEVRWRIRQSSGQANPLSGMYFCGKGMLFWTHGSRVPASGGIAYVNSEQRKPVALVMKHFNKPFNSIQDLILDENGGIWFTDSSLGYESGFRPPPVLPNLVYYFGATSGILRVVADGIKKPMGITISLTGGTLYVADAGALQPNGKVDPTSSAAIYAFTIRYLGSFPILIDKRLFAHAKRGAPTFLRCDRFNNI
ncbi:hypothetical protein F5Y11DRAFT_323145 [Daldinia sp. FL1419]|nr:hypothetical protein F5Y11DRAFT_323145 [Daldinia sp. FL1419]